jgi:[ribosomal protein S18]-alanine N-acetyltransferase
MNFLFTPMNEADALAIQSWTYEAPYDIYNWEAEHDISVMLDTRSPHYAVKNEQGILIGFFSYGSSALIWDSGEPHMFCDNNTISIGLGMRPDLTGKGQGLSFVNAGLDFAMQQFKPDHFRLFVLPFNTRAILVYERAGFQKTGTYLQHHTNGDREFIEMRKALEPLATSKIPDLHQRNDTHAQEHNPE